MQETIGEDLIELVEILSTIETSPSAIKQNESHMLDNEGNSVEF
jgi:hypothetical protein